jgi:protein dithiol oxidoreductase (disulfide-forming)
MTRLAWLAAVSCLILAACGQSSKTPETATLTQTAPAASTPAIAKPAAAPAKPAPTASQPAEIVNAGEDLETVDPNESATAQSSPLLAAALTATPAATLPGPWQENVHYTRLVPTQPTVNNLKSGQVEIAEVFWYGCPHCYALDPLIEAWLKRKPAYVQFVRVPAMWNEGAKLHARLFYTLEALNQLDVIHAAVFNEIHQNHNLLLDKGGDPVKSAEIQAQFATRFGVTPAQYVAAYNSFGVDQKLRRAEQLNRAYLVTSVPTFVVNGKYWTDVQHAGGEEQIFALLNDLAAFEKRGR